MYFDIKETLQFIVCVLGIAIIGGIYFIGWYLKIGRKKVNLIKDATSALLRAEMLQIANECRKRHYTTLEDMRSFEACYKPYHAMGFNDVGDKLHKEMQDLPLKSHD